MFHSVSEPKWKLVSMYMDPIDHDLVIIGRNLVTLWLDLYKILWERNHTNNLFSRWKKRYCLTEELLGSSSFLLTSWPPVCVTSLLFNACFATDCISSYSSPHQLDLILWRNLNIEFLFLLNPLEKYQLYNKLKLVVYIYSCICFYCYIIQTADVFIYKFSRNWIVDLI